MSRTQKLYERLDRIEEEYVALLRDELEAVLHGGLGHYLGCQLRQDWYRYICSGPNDRTKELQSLEKQSRELRSKLGEPTPGDAVGVAFALVRRIKDSGKWSPGTNKAWLRESVADLLRLEQPRP